MRLEQDQVAVLQRWREHGADWRAVELTPSRVIVDLLTCCGEPVDRVESEDPAVIRYVRAEGRAA